MPTLSIPHTIANTQTSDASKIMANYQAIVDWANNNAVHLDGSKQLTALLSLVGLDPTQDNHAARKKYVDDREAAAIATAAADATSKADAAETAAKDASLPITGGTMQGHISRAADPSAADHLARKSYVDGLATTAKYAQAQISANYSTTGTSSNRVTVSVNCDKAGFAIVTCTFDVICNGTGGAFVGEFKYNGGGAETRNAVFNPGVVGGRATISQTWVMPVTAGSKDYTLAAYETGGDYEIQSPHTNIAVTVIEQ